MAFCCCIFCNRKQVHVNDENYEIDLNIGVMNKSNCAHKEYNQSYCAMWCLSDKGVIFGAPLTEEGISQIFQLIEYLSKSEYYVIYMHNIYPVEETFIQSNVWYHDYIHFAYVTFEGNKFLTMIVFLSDLSRYIQSNCLISLHLNSYKNSIC